MARTLDPAAHTVRRDAFVDAGIRLMQVKGFEQMSIQDLLDELGASRGAFYHYFESKQQLLEAIVDRMVDAGLAEVAPIVADETGEAIQKLRAVFNSIGRWKTERKQLVLALLRVWISDDNAIVREKFRRTVVKRMAPILTGIIRQGVREGTFHTSSPESTAEVLVMLLEGFQDKATDLFLAREAGLVEYDEVLRGFTAQTEAFERILGSQPGSIELIDEPTLRAWFG